MYDKSNTGCILIQKIKEEKKITKYDENFCFPAFPPTKFDRRENT